MQGIVAESIRSGQPGMQARGGTDISELRSVSMV